MATVTQVIDQMLGCKMPPLPAGHPILDGKYHRFGPQKKAWYILREVTLASGKSVITGAFGIFQGGNRNTVPVTMDTENFSDDDRAELSRKQRDYEAKEAAAKRRGAELAANRATDQSGKASATVGSAHPYLTRKQITAEKVRIANDGMLLVPMIHYTLRESRLVGLQKIDADGNKRYSKDMDKPGAACLLGAPAGAPIIAIGEGYATCRTVRMAMADELPVAVAFDAGNLLAVARVLRRDFENAHLVFLADDDYQLERRFTERLREDFNVSAPVPIDGATHAVLSDKGDQVQASANWRQDPHGIDYIEANVSSGRLIRTYKYENAGVSRCHAAVKAVGNASLVVPKFVDRGGNKWTDFNDLHVEESLDVVTAQIKAALDAAMLYKISPLPSGADVAEPEMQSHRFDNIPLDDSPPPPGRDGDALGLSSGDEGESRKGKKERPKKEYGPEHWDQVDYVLKNFILVYGEDLVWDVSQRMLMKISSMRIIVQNNDVMRFWTGEQRRWVLKKNIEFDPSERPSPATSGPTATVNLFGGWKMTPKQGKFLKIQTLLLHLCDGDEDLMLWVLRCLAYPLRHRGAKMETSIIMHGDEGSGKNLFFEKIIKKIYGEYGYVIGNAQLESQFNDWASMKLFMVADEVVTRSELKQMKGKLKYLVSGDSIIVNPKGLPEHSEANHINFVFLSNELQPLALDKTDRRYLVIWTPPALSREFYVEVAQEIETGGIAAFYHYLLHGVDMGDFNEHTKPVYNDAKDNLIEKSLSPPERFYRDWSRGFLPLPVITCGVSQLYDAYRVWCEKSGEARYISLTVFSPTVERYAGEALVKKLIKYELGSSIKQRHVFLIGKQPDGKSFADWAAEASSLFESHLKAYRSRSSQNCDE